MEQRPSVSYWHLWTDADGVSRQKQCAMTEFAMKSMKPPADPQWQGIPTSGKMTTMITVQPVGWVGDWHENPAPQWIVVLAGRWWIESMDGTRIEQGPGEFSLGEDQGSVETGGRKGHRSGTVGSEPAVLMTVRLHVPPLRAPCHFR